MNTMKKFKRSIVWLRTDLRLHDNEAITEAFKNSEELYPVYIFDDRIFKDKTPLGFAKTGAIRTKFILESVNDIKKQFQKKGIDLIVRTGKTEDVIFEIVSDIKASCVFALTERLPEETEIQNNLEKRLWSIGKELYLSKGKMLYYTTDLPFPVSHTPDTFTSFRKEVEKITPIRNPFPAPDTFNTWTLNVNCGVMPDLEDFNHHTIKCDHRSALKFEGGETKALKRLHYYLWESDLIKTYEKTRNQLIGADFSSKFSAWLAQGCISPKQIYSELQKYEKERGSNKSTYWLFFELLWRDYFRLISKRFGSKIFSKYGLYGKRPKTYSEDHDLFNAWIDGKTGQPFIDANMIELKLSGFMSNRGRQNVASYLINDLNINWKWGAEYFESQLIDYDASSNWGNWLYIAGLGNDPREDRYFNPVTQSRRYDPEAEYIKLWLPHLSELSADEIHDYQLTSK